MTELFRNPIFCCTDSVFCSKDQYARRPKPNGFGLLCLLWCVFWYLQSRHQTELLFARKDNWAIELFDIHSLRGHWQRALKAPVFLLQLWDSKQWHWLVHFCAPYHAPPLIVHSMKGKNPVMQSQWILFLGEPMNFLLYFGDNGCSDYAKKDAVM